MKKFVIVFPALLIIAVLTCSKPRMNDPVQSYPTSVFFYTSLYDTIPAKNVNAFLQADIQGIKLRALHGAHEVRYFEYHADPDRVLDELSKVGFVLSDVKADTTFRSIAFDELQFETGLAESESKYASSFWNADQNKFEAYECLKTPMKHQVLIDRQSNRILHRVVYLSV